MSREDCSIIKKAIATSLQFGVPFIAYSLPNDDNIKFFSSPDELNASNNNRVVVSSWLDVRRDIIYDKLNAYDTLLYIRNSAARPAPWSCFHWNKSTERDKYLANLSQLIASLKTRGGKTVISTANNFEFTNPVSFDWFADLWFSLCDIHLSDFCFIFYTPLTGAWLGATPEKLLSVDFSNMYFSTMALAGTRPLKEENQPWDDKNIEEHNIVTNYIIDVLQSFGVTAHKAATTNLSYGSIEHLITPINGHLPENSDVYKIISSLSPTPALSGYPVDIAIKEINRYESHPRRMYGGFIAIETGSKIDAFVNLRSMQFDQSGCCLYAGGGITASSIPTVEWEETRLKIQAFLSHIDPLGEK